MRVDDFAPDDIVHAFEVTGLEPKPGFVYHNGCGCALGALMCLEMGHLPVTFGQAMGISHAEEILGLTSLQAWAIGDGWDAGFRGEAKDPAKFAYSQFPAERRLYEMSYEAGRRLRPQ